jgi:radical SAM superfamily enzyme YgiQ (UPF0313 family)
MKKYPLPPDVKINVNQTTLLTTSRGCPMGCKFCETTHAWGRIIRSASAKKLFKQVKYLYENSCYIILGCAALGLQHNLRHSGQILAPSP